MSKGLVAVLVVVAVLAVLGVGYVGMVFAYRADCVSAEAGIKAQYQQNQNNYDNMWKKFKEMSQVPDMYVADMKKLWDETMLRRYGEGGSQAIFQFLKEHNPQLDSAVYTKIQAAIEAGRNSFESDQKELLDKKRVYEVILRGNRALFVGFWFGYPLIDLDEYNIVTSDVTDAAFKTKKSGPIQLR